MDPEQAWQSVLLDELQRSVDQASFDAFLRDTCFVSLEDGVFTVAAQDQGTCDKLNKKVSEIALAFLRSKLKQLVIEVRFIVRSPEPEQVGVFDTVVQPVGPEQAWQEIVRQLQTEMPRASFETWVRDSQFFSFEAGVYKVAVRNAYARDWLEDRLASTVSSLLAGILDQPVEVRFIVSGDEFVAASPDAPAERGLDQADAPPDLTSSVVRARISLSEYERIVKPGRKIVFAAYFLRHIARIGPELGWIVIALRQLVFLNHDAKPIPGREIARWSGMSKRAFWRWSKRLNTIPEFVDRRLEIIGGQRVIAYTVWADDACPLTPADARSLVAALTDMLQQHGSPEQVASALMEMTSAEIRARILPLEPNLLEDVSGECVTINELVQWLGWPPELGARLEKRIMDAFGLTILTWHFVLELLPALDHGPAWMITILRDLCYDGREQRSSALLPPATLARMCGLEGKWMTSTLNTWLRKPLTQSMVADENLGDRTLGPEKPHRYHVSFFDSILAEQPSRESGTGVEGERHKGRGKVAQPLRESGTRVEAKWHSHRGQVAQGLRPSGTTLNLFNPLDQPLLNPLLTSTNQPGALKIDLAKTTTSGGSVGGRESWVLSEILHRCAISPKKRDAILLGVTALDFVAHLIYAHSPWGHSIKTPVSWTVSQVLDPDRYGKAAHAIEKKMQIADHRKNMHVRQDPHKDQYSEVFKTLACLPPGELAHLLELQYLGVSLPLTPVLIDSGLNRMSPNAVRALAACLGRIELIEPEVEGET